MASDLVTSFTKAAKAAHAGHCRAAITYLGMGWRTFGGRFGAGAGPRAGYTGYQIAQRHKALARLQGEVLTACDIRNGARRMPQLGRARRRRR